MTGEERAGWGAIDGALRRLYGDAGRWLFDLASMGQEGPLRAIGVHVCDEARPHWHYVTYGFSELDAKTWENRRKSGWGFEMSFRLSRSESDREPEQWPLPMLQSLARYVFETGSAFDVGHHIYMGAPLVPGCTLLDNLVFALDAKLGKIDTPHGRVKFLTPVGVFQAERTSIEQNQYYGFLRRYARYSPLFVTDLARHDVFVET